MNTFISSRHRLHELRRAEAPAQPHGGFYVPIRSGHDARHRKDDGGAPRALPRLYVNVLDPLTPSGTNVFPRLGDALGESGIVFQAVIDPVVFRGEADENSRRLAVPRFELSPRSSPLPSWGYDLGAGQSYTWVFAD